MTNNSRCRAQSPLICCWSPHLLRLPKAPAALLMVLRTMIAAGGAVVCSLLPSKAQLKSQAHLWLGGTLASRLHTTGNLLVHDTTFIQGDSSTYGSISSILILTLAGSVTTCKCVHVQVTNCRGVASQQCSGHFKQHLYQLSTSDKQNAAAAAAAAAHKK